MTRRINISFRRWGRRCPRSTARRRISVRLLAPERGEAALQPGQGGAQRRGDRNLEQSAIRVAGALERAQVDVGALVSVEAHLAHIAGERGGTTAAWAPR